MIKALLVFALCVSVPSAEPSYSGVESSTRSGSTASVTSATTGSVASVTSASNTTKAVANTPAQRMDVRPDTPNWEYSITAMTEAINYTNSYVQKKYPANTSKSGIFINHKVEIISVNNITPEEVNSPDIAVNANNYYASNVNQGLLAIFLVEARITQTQAGMNQRMQLLGNISQMMGQENATQTVGESRIINKYYLVSIPNRPFYRAGANNPLANPIIAGNMQELGIETSTKIQHEEIKALFPTQKASIKELSAEQVKALSSGDVSTLSGQSTK